MLASMVGRVELDPARVHFWNRVLWRCGGGRSRIVSLIPGVRVGVEEDRVEEEEQEEQGAGERNDECLDRE